ncbi:M15 family metallopeptidase [Dyella sp. 20L07]|uniref:M15 family metallopeptidase n=1 Tax=Dyella sp. 20L07 TaxID=3384240 RepID=UPI003D2BFE43
MTSRTSPFSESKVVIEPRRIIGWLACLLLAGPALADTTPTLSSAQTAKQAGLVDIRQLMPDIAEDIKYAGNDNFVGSPVDGYLAPKCLLLRPAAEALARVEQQLRERHQRLQLFDCYRPARAVKHFVRWAGDLADQRTKAEHYPDLDKSALLGDYIAPVSGHSRGATVDLTLLQCDADNAHCTPLDMGTDFDYFGTRANTESPQVTAAQHAHRELLRAAMEHQGFRNYAMEWWHYTLTPEPTPGTIYDVPVQ